MAFDSRFLHPSNFLLIGPSQVIISEINLVFLEKLPIILFFYCSQEKPNLLDVY